MLDNSAHCRQRKSNKARSPFLIRVMDTFFSLSAPSSYRWTLRRSKGSNESSLELCNSFAINSQITRLKLKKKNTHNNNKNRKLSEKTRDPLAVLSSRKHFSAGCLVPWRLITIKALALFICLVQRMGRYYRQTMKECVCVYYIYRERGWRRGLDSRK